jgi:hypothetical protein
MDNSPKLGNIVKNDTGAFMCTWPPIFFALLSVALFLKNGASSSQYTDIELFYISSIIFFSISFCLWPFVLWWRRVITQTFKDGIELQAASCKMKLRFVIGLGVKYTFTYNGKHYEHIASLVSNSKMRKLANEPEVSIVYNPEKNISFIKNAYL